MCALNIFPVEVPSKAQYKQSCRKYEYHRHMLLSCDLYGGDEYVMNVYLM